MNGQAKTQMRYEYAQSVKAPTGIGSEKRCTKCGEIKPLSEFYVDRNNKDGLRGNCKDCQRAQSTKWRKENPERHRQSQKKWREVNAEKARERSRLWRINNPEWAKEQNRSHYARNTERRKKESQEWRKNNRERHIKSVLEWRKANPERAKEYDRKSGERIRATPKGKLKASISRGISHSLKTKKAGRHWEDLVGYTVEQLIKHLEKQFTKEMTWENYGEWHIDHIIPISAFNYETPEHIDFKRCWALNNLRPLKAHDNLSKYNKLERPFQPALMI